MKTHNQRDPVALERNSASASHRISPVLPSNETSHIGKLRHDMFQSANNANYDVAIIGAGISGTRIYHELRRLGRRVLLIDRGDFSCGTSQASGMMIWGGLLYLKNLDIYTVRKLCSARDELIESSPDKVVATKLRYLVGRKSLRNRHLVHAGMMLYWLIGNLKRRFPKYERYFAELDLLKPKEFRGSLAFEEAILKGSDCRYALEWMLPFITRESPALNHCLLEKAVFDASHKSWTLELRDRLHGYESIARARFIINAAGVWTDTVNENLRIQSPYRHEFSKGVYITFPRPKKLEHILISETGINGDTLTISPWGPVVLCGPTETRITDIHEGFKPSSEDVGSLLQMANRNLKSKLEINDIVSLRCGIRPLAVSRNYTKIVHPLDLSRRHEVHCDSSRNVVSVYGGKLTSCGVMAEEVSSLIAPKLGPIEVTLPRNQIKPRMEKFPGLSEMVLSAEWSRDHEYCHTLEDYLRRRTNIAQWIPRCGLGKNSENLEILRHIAGTFSDQPAEADHILSDYQNAIRDKHDRILSNS